MTLSPGPSLPAPFPRNSLNCSGPWSPAEPYSRSSCHSPCPERRVLLLSSILGRRTLRGREAAQNDRANYWWSWARDPKASFTLGAAFLGAHPDPSCRSLVSLTP